MNKTINVYNDTAYFIGVGKNDIEYYMLAPKTRVNGQWEIGIVLMSRESEYSETIKYCFYFADKFLDEADESFYKFKEFFKETPFTDKKIWELLDLLKTADTLTRAADLTIYGHSHIANINTNVSNAVQRNDIEKEINEKILPVVAEEITKILKGEKDMKTIENNGNNNDDDHQELVHERRVIHHDKPEL